MYLKESLKCIQVQTCVNVSIFTAIAIKESAKVGDQAQRRAAKGIDDLGKMQQNIRNCNIFLKVNFKEEESNSIAV